MRNPFHQSKYFLPCLNRQCRIAPTIALAYHEGDELRAGQIKAAVAPVVAQLQEFYACAHSPHIAVFVYPDLRAMSAAFGRELLSDDWCFAPVRSAYSLVTFTASIAQETIQHVLAHEFSHVYFSLVTGNVEVDRIRQSIPLWLDEGVALCLDSQYRHRFAQTRERRLRVLKAGLEGYFPRLMDLYTYFNHLDDVEFGPRSDLAYCFSSVCVQELVNQFGWRHLADFLHLPGLAEQFDPLFAHHFREPLATFNARMTAQYGPPGACAGLA